MSVRRFTRPTDGFGKTLENWAHAIAPRFILQDFEHINQTLCMTPVMAVGVSDHVWSLEEVAALVPHPAAKKHGLYRKLGAQTERSNCDTTQ